MKDYSKAFKAFDIRAVRNDPIDNSFAYSLGQAIGKDLVARKGHDATFVIGADPREWNNGLIYWFIKGLEIAGIWNYIGMGLSVDSPEEQSQERGVCSSALFYYFAGGKFDMGAMFTASHNPPEYAGMKIVNEKGHLIESSHLLSLVDEREDISDMDIDMHDYQRIWEIAMTRDDDLRDSLYASEKAYREMLQNLFAPITKKMTIVVDFSNGGAISYERTFLDGLMHTSDLKFIYINDAADSMFTAHLSDTTDPHDYKQLIQTVLDEGADMGIMFDGDGDRLGMVDELGNIIFGDISGGIIATNILQTQTGKTNVIHDVFHSRLVTDAISAAGGTPIKSRVGHRFVKEKFQEHNAAFGGEISGHQFFNEVGGFEAPLCALGHFLAQVQKHESVSQTVAPLLTSCKPPLCIIKVEDRQKSLSNIEKHYTAQGYEIDHTDGVGIYTNDRRAVIRASHTEPILRLCIETDNETKYNEILKEIEELLN